MYQILFYFLRPGKDYEFADYPSPLHIEKHMEHCLLNHDFSSDNLVLANREVQNHQALINPVLAVREVQNHQVLV